MTDPTVLSSADFPLAELSALRLDGIVYPVDACYSPVDQPDFPSVRAAALARLWPRRLIVEQHSAAWVHGALRTPPVRHELCADIRARARPTNLHAAAVREVVIEQHEVVQLGGIGVTTPPRTVTDLARFSTSFDQHERMLCARLLLIGAASVEQCIAAVDTRAKLANKQLAIDRLESIRPALRQLEETR